MNMQETIQTKDYRLSTVSIVLGVSLLWSGALTAASSNSPSPVKTPFRLLMPNPDQDQVSFGVGIAPKGTEKGCTISKVFENSPAAKAGLLVGDVIIQCDDQTVTQADDLFKFVKTKKVGDEIKVTVARQKVQKTFTVKLERRPPEAAPDFEATHKNGEKIKLRDLKGQVVIIVWFLKDCASCDKQLRNITGLAKKYNSQDLKIGGLPFGQQDPKKIFGWAVDKFGLDLEFTGPFNDFEGIYGQYYKHTHSLKFGPEPLIVAVVDRKGNLVLCRTGAVVSSDDIDAVLAPLFEKKAKGQ